MAETKLQFEFPAGTGVIRSKITPDFTTMYFGRICLPDVGQCFVDGTAPKGATEAKLAVKRATDRQVIATLVLPRGTAEKREGTIKVKGRRAPWRVVATVRRNEKDEPRLALRLPEVKIAGAYF